jgi:mRNA interferase RelE/StbE
MRTRLPGDVRQRIRRAIDDLAQEARPPTSKGLALPEGLDARIRTEWEARRIKLDDWRIVYAINETWREIAVLSVRQRPPYDYEDLDDMLAEL